MTKILYLINRKNLLKELYTTAALDFLTIHILILFKMYFRILLHQMLFLVSKTNLVFIEDIITFNYSDHY